MDSIKILSHSIFFDFIDDLKNIEKFEYEPYLKYIYNEDSDSENEQVWTVTTQIWYICGNYLIRYYYFCVYLQ